MRLRTDYKYALIDQFQTYWNAFDNTEEFYSDIMATDEKLLKYTISKTKKVRGIKGFVSKVIYSQNELWMIYYCCLLYTSPSPRDISGSRMPSSA